MAEIIREGKNQDVTTRGTTLEGHNQADGGNVTE